MQPLPDREKGAMRVMNKIDVSLHKTLKLQNVLIRKIEPFEVQDIQPQLELEKMNSFIRANGAIQIGPVIQYNECNMNATNKLEVSISFLLQCNQGISKIQEPYEMKTSIVVPNCMYCHYIGPEEKMKLAYDKMQIVSFENNIALKNESYTIILERDIEGDTIVADIFMECEE